MTRILTIAHTVWMGVIRRKDVYVLLILLGVLLAILVSLNVFGLGGAVRYVKDLGLLIAWLFSIILTINISSRELPTEEVQGTIFPLLAKPIARSEVIAGKWLGAWTVASASTLLFYGLVAAVVRAKGGTFSLAALCQGYILHCTALGVISAAAVAFSTRMNHDATASITYVFTAASLLIVPRVPELMTHESGFTANALMFLYHALPHLEVFDMRKRLVHDFGPTDYQTFWIVIIYGILFSSFFLLAGWFAYRNRKFLRNNLM
jgi:ABC-type transport system involved in multi-copper enzyme maturation permease subunit